MPCHFSANNVQDDCGFAAVGVFEVLARLSRHHRVCAWFQFRVTVLTMSMSVLYQHFAL